MTQKKQPTKAAKKKSNSLGYQLPRHIVAPHNGTRRITVGAGCEAFVLGHDGEYPAELAARISRMEQMAVVVGRNEAIEEMQQKSSNQVMKPLPPAEEASKELTNLLRMYGDKDRNKIVALVLYNIEKELKLKQKQFQGNLDKATQDLEGINSIGEGFEAIRGGDYEKLNIQ